MGEYLVCCGNDPFTSIFYQILILSVSGLTIMVILGTRPHKRLKVIALYSLVTCLHVPRLTATCGQMPMVCSWLYQWQVLPRGSIITC